MRKLKKLSNIYNSLLLENGGFNGGHLIVVDVQEAYYNGFRDWFPEFIDFMNNNYHNFNRVTFLFNGPDLGFPDKTEYIHWLNDHGLDEVVINYIQFYDKGYAFFRYCIDEGIEDESIADLVRFMYQNNINDTRDFDEQMWNKFINEHGHDDVRELMEYIDDSINIPDLMKYLEGVRGNLILCGGGVNECMKEVEIALMALGKPYTVFEKFTY